MRIRAILRFIWLVLVLLPLPFRTAADQDRWWPIQATPKALVRLQKDLPEPRVACDMMAQSVAGLAAKAVNEGRSDEMVWVGTDNIDVEDWLARLLTRQPQMSVRGTFALWDLIDRYAGQGIIEALPITSSRPTLRDRASAAGSGPSCIDSGPCPGANGVAWFHGGNDRS